MKLPFSVTRMKIRDLARTATPTEILISLHLLHIVEDHMIPHLMSVQSLVLCASQILQIRLTRMISLLHQTKPKLREQEVLKQNVAFQSRETIPDLRGSKIIAARL